MPPISDRALLILLAAITALGPIATNLYLPALPAVREHFGASVATVQTTFSVSLVTFAFGILVWGPIADRYGRRFAVDSLGAEMERHADEARDTAARAKALLGEVHREMHGAVAAAEEGSGRAQEGAQVIHGAAETMRSLSRALGESARAAREIAGVSQQQQTAIEQVMNAMNEIYLASEEMETSTHEVADEAQALSDLAAALKRSVRQETPK